MPAISIRGSEFAGVSVLQNADEVLFRAIQFLLNGVPGSTKL